MESLPNTIYVVYYLSVNNEWRPSIPTPYKENAIKHAKIFDASKIVEYSMEQVVPFSKKVRKIRKVVTD